jgi:hypothetical protein
MDKTLTAVFDGEVLRPDSPLDLAPNTRYVITIQPLEQPVVEQNAWDVLEPMTGTVEAPSDWTSKHDHYLGCE